MKNRRDMLAIMGLSSAAVALNTETIARAGDIYNGDASKGHPHLIANGERAQEATAKALENLAAGIRSGDIAVRSLSTASKLERDDFLSHIVTFECELLHRDEA